LLVLKWGRQIVGWGDEQNSSEKKEKKSGSQNESRVGNRGKEKATHLLHSRKDEARKTATRFPKKKWYGGEGAY